MAVTRLSVITPATTKFDGYVDLVIAPGSAGDLGALAKHAPLLTTLRVGVVRANVASPALPATPPFVLDGRLELAVDGGFMEVLSDKVIILADAALSRDEVDIEATRSALRRAEEALAQKRGADDAAERRAVAWANAKLEVRRVPTVE